MGLAFRSVSCKRDRARSSFSAPRTSFADGTSGQFECGLNALFSQDDRDRFGVSVCGDFAVVVVSDHIRFYCSNDHITTVYSICTIFGTQGIHRSALNWRQYALTRDFN